MSDQGEFDKEGHFKTGTTGYSMTAQINDLNAELREARAQIAELKAQIAALKTGYASSGAVDFYPPAKEPE